ncbi:MAG: cyclic nucleotide-binding domain-containing protein [Planctomycetes bacterium]|nr:cyclic nucleotide-binding domain-containing protein [Planctomycetota bacterium]
MPSKESKIQLIPICPGSHLLQIKDLGISWIFNPWPDISKFLIQKELSFNGVVCPDTRVQHGVNCNLIEFPLLHALFNQGMIFKGLKPVMIGTSFQLENNSSGFKRAMYGFYNTKELRALGMEADEANALMKEIKGLSYNGIMPIEDLLEFCVLEPLEDNPTLKSATKFKGMKIWKENVNVFVVQWRGETVTIDCNLKEDEQYSPPLKIDVKNIPFTMFQVIDTGEEDGFSPNSCMHTVVQWREKIICIDLPMNVSYLLERISISKYEIDAVIFTHCHDDHIGDLPLLMQLGKKIKILCPRVIWQSILLKAASMLYMAPEEFDRYFDYTPLEYGKDFHYCGLRIMAFPSIHSVPCALYRIRGMIRGEWKTYCHLSDILNLKRTRELLKNGIISKKRYNAYREFLLQKADIKKIDVGTVTGMEAFSVHGHWRDFIDDETDHIILGHINANLLDEEAQVQVGQLAVVGSARDLSMGMEHSYIDKYIERAIKFLTDYMLIIVNEKLLRGELSREDIDDVVRQFANQEIKLIQPRTPFLKTGQESTYVDMVVSGIGSVWESNKKGVKRIAIIQAGDLIGDMGVLRKEPRNASIRADTYMRVLRIPGQLFRDEMVGLGLFDPKGLISLNVDCAFSRIWHFRQRIQRSSLLGRDVPVYLQNKLAIKANCRVIKRGGLIYSSEKKDEVVFAVDASAAKIVGWNVKLQGQFLTSAFFGEDKILKRETLEYEVRAKKEIEVLYFDLNECEWMNEIPIYMLRLKELYDKRGILLHRT